VETPEPDSPGWSTLPKPDEPMEFPGGKAPNGEPCMIEIHVVHGPEDIGEEGRRYLDRFNRAVERIRGDDGDSGD
jgi:hypothetical protein